MYQKAESIYLGLSVFVLGAALFVVQPSTRPEVATWQSGITNQFSVAWQQTIGDQSWFDDAALFYDSIASFYDQSANVTISLLEHPESDADIAYVYGEVYNSFVSMFNPNSDSEGIAYTEVQLPEVSATFMTQEPMYNIVPYREVVTTINETSYATAHTGAVSGASIANNYPVNSKDLPWVTIADNSTGQLYCLAVYNGTVNQYLGPCKYDGYF